MEQGKTKTGKLPRPVFFGDEGAYLRTYEIDAFEPSNGIALEVEAGRATMGNAIYRDLCTELCTDLSAPERTKED